ncbi:hypothetical protein HYQ46_005096 [Verticillium longisporum]|nr:hypothetical protein HYQ46_005096 [Verticillium longisporum]
MPDFQLMSITRNATSATRFWPAFPAKRLELIYAGQPSVIRYPSTQSILKDCRHQSLTTHQRPRAITNMPNRLLPPQRQQRNSNTTTALLVLTIM